VGKDLHFVAETFANGFVTQPRSDQLDRYLLFEALVVSLREIDCAHAAVAYLSQDFVRTDARSFFCRILIRTKPESSGRIRRALLDDVATGIDSLGQQQI